MWQRAREWGKAVLVMWLMATSVAAQNSATGSLTGTVSDPSGGVLPGVTVRATNPATGLSQSTITSTAGDWTIASLPVGRYELSFELDGFKKLTRSDVLVEAVVTRQVPVTLEVGSVAEVVNCQRRRPHGRRQHRRHLPAPERRRADPRPDVHAQLYPSPLG